VKGRAESQPKEILIVGKRLDATRIGANLHRRAVIGFADRRVEPADRSISCGNCELRHRQIRFVDQLFGEVHAARLRHCVGRGAQMAQEQSAQMAGTHTEPFGEPLHSAVFCAAFVDQTQRPRNGGRGPEPGGRSRRAFRPAAQAGAITCFGRLGGRREIAAILFFRRRRRTNRAAIDAAAPHTDEEFAVEAGIARKPRPRTHSPIESRFLHGTENTPSAPRKLDIFGPRSTAGEVRKRPTLSAESRIVFERSVVLRGANGEEGIS
jgi:hypothetical protein